MRECEHEAKMDGVCLRAAPRKLCAMKNLTTGSASLPILLLPNEILDVVLSRCDACTLARVAKAAKAPLNGCDGRKERIASMAHTRLPPCQRPLEVLRVYESHGACRNDTDVNALLVRRVHGLGAALDSNDAIASISPQIKLGRWDARTELAFRDLSEMFNRGDDFARAGGITLCTRVLGVENALRLQMHGMNGLGVSATYMTARGMLDTIKPEHVRAIVRCFCRSYSEAVRTQDADKCIPLLDLLVYSAWTIESYARVTHLRRYLRRRWPCMVGLSGDVIGVMRDCLRRITRDVAVPRAPLDVHLRSCMVLLWSSCLSTLSLLIPDPDARFVEIERVRLQRCACALAALVGLDRQEHRQLAKASLALIK